MQICATLGLSLLTIFLSARSVSARSEASPAPQLDSFFAQKISGVEHALSQMPAADASQGFVIQDYNIDLTPNVTFGISGVLSLTISPEIDFVLTPSNP